MFSFIWFFIKTWICVGIGLFLLKLLAEKKDVVVFFTELFDAIEKLF